MIFQLKSRFAAVCFMLGEFLMTYIHKFTVFLRRNVVFLRFLTACGAISSECENINIFSAQRSISCGNSSIFALDTVDITAQNIPDFLMQSIFSSVVSNEPGLRNISCVFLIPSRESCSRDRDLLYFQDLLPVTIIYHTPKHCTSTHFFVTRSQKSNLCADT